MQTSLQIEGLIKEFMDVRNTTLELFSPLDIEDAVMQSSDISWNGQYKLEKSDSVDACPGGYQLVVSPDSYTVEGTVQTTTDAAIESSRSALESGGWTTSLLEGQKKNGVTPLYLSGHRPDLGTIYVRFNDTVTIGVSSVCFKG